MLHFGCCNSPRYASAKVAEVFHLTGKITPIPAKAKLYLHNLIERGLYWFKKVQNSCENYSICAEICEKS